MTNALFVPSPEQFPEGISTPIVPREPAVQVSQHTHVCSHTHARTHTHFTLLLHNPSQAPVMVMPQPPPPSLSPQQAFAESSYLNVAVSERAMVLSVVLC